MPPQVWAAAGEAPHLPGPRAAKHTQCAAKECAARTLAGPGLLGVCGMRVPAGALPGAAYWRRALVQRNLLGEQAGGVHAPDGLHAQARRRALGWTQSLGAPVLGDSHRRGSRAHAPGCCTLAPRAWARPPRPAQKAGRRSCIGTPVHVAPGSHAHPVHRAVVLHMAAALPASPAQPIAGLPRGLGLPQKHTLPVLPGREPQIRVGPGARQLAAGRLGAQVLHRCGLGCSARLERCHGHAVTPGTRRALLQQGRCSTGQGPSTRQQQSQAGRPTDLNSAGTSRPSRRHSSRKARSPAEQAVPASALTPQSWRLTGQPARCMHVACRRPRAGQGPGCTRQKLSGRKGGSPGPPWLPARCSLVHSRPFVMGQVPLAPAHSAYCSICVLVSGCSVCRAVWIWSPAFPQYSSAYGSCCTTRALICRCSRVRECLTGLQAPRGAVPGPAQEVHPGDAGDAVEARPQAIALLPGLQQPLGHSGLCGLGHASG